MNTSNISIIVAIFSFVTACGTTPNYELVSDQDINDVNYGDAEEEGTNNDSDNDGDPNETDCAPYDPTIGHGMLEVCDEVDQDCDGDIANGLPQLRDVYEDMDTDGYAGTFVGRDCSDEPAAAGFAYYNADCDDANHAIHPQAAERCDLVDNNCNGTIDEINHPNIPDIDLIVSDGDRTEERNWCSLCAEHLDTQVGEDDWMSELTFGVRHSSNPLNLTWGYYTTYFNAGDTRNSCQWVVINGMGCRDGYGINPDGTPFCREYADQYDTDSDGVPTVEDNCPLQLDPPSQQDSDNDGIGDGCDTAPTCAYFDESC
jgi:hypothetical protein